MHRGDAGQEGRATRRVEDAVSGRDHFVGQLLCRIPLGTLCIGDLRDIVLGPAEHLGVVRALDEVGNLRGETRGADGREVCAAAEFAEDSGQLHRTAGHVGDEWVALHRCVQAETVGVGRDVHRVGRRDEGVEIRDAGEFRTAKVRAALEVCTPRGTRGTLGLRRLPCSTDDSRVEVSEIRGERRTVTVAECATASEHIELHAVQAELLANGACLGSEVEAVAGVTNKWAGFGEERGERRFDGHEPRIVRLSDGPVGQTGSVSPTDLLGLIASILSMLFIWPQVFRVYRNNTVEGLAPLGALQGMSGSILWSIYGLSQSDMPLFGSNLLLSIAIALLAVAMTRHRILASSTLFLVVAGILGVGFVAGSVSTTLLGMLAFAVGALSVIPQTVKVLRDPDLQGVSVSSNSLLFVTSCAWMSYGVAIRDTLVWLPNVLVIPCSAIIVAKARAAQLQQARANVPEHVS